MPRTVHFEIQASHPQALIDFYGALFGWTFSKWDGGDYWQIDTGAADQPGINGGLLPRRGPAPTALASVNAFVCTVDVESLERTLEQLESLPADVVVPKMAIPGVGWLAYAKDPYGNIFGIKQTDPQAM